MIPAGVFLVVALGAGVALTAANILLSRSKGFTLRRKGFAALGLAMLAFFGLAYATHAPDPLHVYALGGVVSIAGTILAGSILMRQKLEWTAWAGLGYVFLGAVLLCVE